VSLAVLAPLAAAAADSADLQSSFDELEKPTIGGEIDPPATLAVGRAEIRPEPGARLLLLSVDGRQVGYLLDGPATLAYRVEDRFSTPAAGHNLKKADGVSVRMLDGTLIATTKLKGAAVWGWDLDLGDAAPRPATGSELPGWLRSNLEQKYSTNPARELMCSEMNGDSGFRWALFHAAGEDLVLHVDPRPQVRTEALFRLEKVRSSRAGPYIGRRFLRELAAQPIGRAWWESTSMELAAIATEIEVTNDRGEHAQVRTRTRLRALRDGLRLLTMQHSNGVLSDNVWHEYRIVDLLVDGQPAPFVHRDGSLLVALPGSSRTGDTFLLEVRAEGDVLQRPEGDNYWRLGGAAWYPRPGRGGQEWAEIRVTVDVPAPLVPFTGGELLARSSEGGRNRVEARLDAPMGFAMVVAGNYRTVTEELDGARVHISTYAAAKEEATRRVGQVVLSVMDCLESWLGVPYPFQDLQVVEVTSWGWGQAPPGLIFITQEAFLTRASSKIDAESTLLSSETARGINARVAHEVAHAWFPHVAKVVRPEENWLSESLADYASAICLEQKMGNKRKGRQLFDRQLREWKAWSKEAGDASSVYLANHLGAGADAGTIRRKLLYGRGPLALHVIRQELNRRHGEEKGDRLFFAWLRSYVKNFTYKVAETRHLIGILNQLTGEDWQPFFERHIYGPEGPVLD